MEKIILEKDDFYGGILFNKIKSYISNYLKNKPTLIFDIHNTIEYENGIDQTIFKFIKDNHKKVNIILLSYDGNDERIIFNNDILDNYSDIFKNIPKIFIKKRKKHYIIGYLSKILRHNFIYNDYMYFIDDNYMNITDAYKLTNIKKLKVIHYTAHTKRKSDEGIEDLKSILLNVV